MVYASHDYAGKKGIWEIILEIQQNTAECPYTQYIEEFFRIALIANEKSCENNDPAVQNIITGRKNCISLQ